MIEPPQSAEAAVWKQEFPSASCKIFVGEVRISREENVSIHNASTLEKRGVWKEWREEIISLATVVCSR